jgi:dolichol-phosphate mannosyltransferase
MTPQPPILSLVVPCYNEAENLPALFAAIFQAVEPLKIPFEIIVTDDCSQDCSWEVLEEFAARDRRLRVQRLAFNSGESAASWAGIQAAGGRYIATLDADLQNDPRDLPQFLKSLEQFDCVCGTRVNTRSQGDHFIRVASSRIANGVRNKLSGERISDAGCTYRAFKRECVANLKFFKGMHRFLPTLIKMEGFTVTEIPVSSNPRFAGKSHYGVWNRLFGSFYDLMAVRWMKRRMFRCRVAESLNCQTTESPMLSLVIPAYNEEGNLAALAASITQALSPLKISYEIIVTDDCSRDGSWELLKVLAARDSRLRAQRMASNYGQSAAAWAGMQIARGRYIVTLDADLQNDPRDLPKLLNALEHCDCVCGTRVDTRKQGDNFVRIASSRIANWVRNKLSHEEISDAGCPYRAFKRECVANLKFFKGMHRFLPTLIKMEGYTVTEISVSTNPRFAGKGNYGIWNRLFASFYDLLAVRWMKQRMFRLEIVKKIN